MLNCFVDDSGSDKKGPVFVLSGYVATVDRWMEFSDEWNGGLTSGPHKLDYFKMQEAVFSKKGQFKGWSRQEREAKIMELAAIIKRHVSFNVTAVLWWEDYKKVQARYAQLPMKPYLLLFMAITNVAIRHIIDVFPHHEKIKFIFDDQGKTGDFAADAYRLAQSMLPRAMVARVASVPSFEDEKVFLPLQAADISAWNHRRFCYKNEHHKKNYKNYEMTPCMRVLDEITTVAANLDGKWLRSFFEALKQGAPMRISKIPPRGKGA